LKDSHVETFHIPSGIVDITHWGDIQRDLENYLTKDSKSKAVLDFSAVQGFTPSALVSLSTCIRKAHGRLRIQNWSEKFITPTIKYIELASAIGSALNLFEAATRQLSLNVALQDEINSAHQKLTSTYGMLKQNCLDELVTPETVT
jgi:hypothetical protein